MPPSIRYATKKIPSPYPEWGRNWLQVHAKFVTRLADSRRILTKTNGNLYTVGDLFRQIDLASTLKKIAHLGSTYMYEGEWASRFVDAVRREGGNMTLKDLTAYRAFWTDPIEISYRDHRVVTLGPPNKGGMQTLASLKLAEVAGLKQYGHYTRSAQALYYLIQFSRIQGVFANTTPSTLQGLFLNVDLSPDSRLTPNTVQQLWNLIQAREVRVPHVEKQGPDHSAGVVVVDSKGNVASVLHTSNCVRGDRLESLWMAYAYPTRLVFSNVRSRIPPAARACLMEQIR